MKGRKKLKTRVNRLSIIVLAIMVVFVATASFNIISANTDSNENGKKEDISYDYDVDTNIDTTTKKNFKTADEAYRYAIKNLENVKEYNFYVTNGIVDVDVMSGIKFTGGINYEGKKDSKNNTYSLLALCGSLGNLSEVVEIYEGCNINGNNYYRHVNKDFVDRDLLKPFDPISNSGLYYDKLTNSQMKSKFDIELGIIPFKIDSSTILTKKISYTGYEYIISFELDSNLAIAPLLKLIDGMMPVSYSVNASGFNVTCKIDSNGYLKSLLATGKLVMNLDYPVVSSIPITANLKTNFVFDYSEGCGNIPYPKQER